MVSVPLAGEVSRWLSVVEEERGRSEVEVEVAESAGRTFPHAVYVLDEYGSFPPVLRPPR